MEVNGEEGRRRGRRRGRMRRKRRRRRRRRRRRMGIWLYTIERSRDESCHPMVVFPITKYKFLMLLFQRNAANMSDFIYFS